MLGRDFATGSGGFFAVSSCVEEGERSEGEDEPYLKLVVCSSSTGYSNVPTTKPINASPYSFGVKL